MQPEASSVEVDLTDRLVELRAPRGVPVGVEVGHALLGGIRRRGKSVGNVRYGLAGRRPNVITDFRIKPK